MEIALGTMNFGGRTAERESLAIVRRALEAGITLLDTANVYGDGASERIVAKALAEHPNAKVATKVGLKRAQGKPEGLAPARIRAAIRESLANLKRPFVDLYYLHAPDPRVPLAETVDALGELLREGLIKSWGMSNYASWEILEARGIAEKKSVPGPTTSQVIYNLVIRQLDIEYFRFAERHPIHTTVYNALAGGLLSGRHRRDAAPEKGSRFDGNTMYQRRYWTERGFALIDAYSEIAKSEGIDLVSLAYAWLAQRKGVDSILVGPATVAQLDAAIEGCKKTLSPAALTAIDRVHQDAQGTDARYAR
ncbi:MAG: aldo/keto reductase [Polyangiales bacterium]